MSKYLIIAFSAACAIGIIVCAIVNFAINQSFTWSLIAFASIIYGWFTIMPGLLLKKHRILVSLIVFTVLAIPFLAVLHLILGMPLAATFDVLITLVGIAYIWCVYALFRIFKNTWLIATGVAMLLAIPLNIVVSLILQGSGLGDTLDFWDMISWAIEFAAAMTLFIAAGLKNRSKKSYVEI